jgi:rRNA maturation RNase YbeY
LSFGFFYDGVKYRIRKAGVLKNVLEKIILISGSGTGNINIILTTDDSLRRINRDFLNHDYYTDVISFDYSDKNTIEGEIYISVDTVRINAAEYGKTFRNELLRVVIHGVLHLTGMDDKTEPERELMRSREDYWLGIFEREENGKKL